VKNNFFFLIFFVLIGCSPKTIIEEKISCPNVLFSDEHDYFVEASETTDINNISYIAEINNFSFNSDCFITDNIAYIDLSLLFIVNPINVANSNIFLPFYIAIIDKKNELKDIQYYNISGNFKIDNETNLYVESELRKKIKFRLLHDDTRDISADVLVVGFMLSKNQLEILN
tara:strand:- start:917 stop:1432 length:516 start_codon:yes stop_codon:yes gene_type:complete